MIFSEKLKLITEGAEIGNSILTGMSSPPERVEEPPAPKQLEGLFDNPFKPQTVAQQVVTPHYVPNIDQVILEGNAELETELIFSYVKTGTGVLRNIVAEMTSLS